MNIKNYLKKSKYETKMGCDYIIVIGLEIEFKDGKSKFVELRRYRMYFDDSIEIDVNSDCEDIDEYIEKKFLKINYKSIVLYEKDKWLDPKFETKYKEDIEIDNDISKVNRITKLQKKYCL